MITSSDNPKVKQARALLTRRGREQQAHCLAEGVRLIEDAMRAGVQPALIFCVPGARAVPRAQALLGGAEERRIPVWEISPAVFSSLSDTTTSQGILAVLPIPVQVSPTAATLILVLDRLRDPGNLGTILRSAEAAGVDEVLLTAGCVDPWSPKVLRSGMGAHFRLRLAAGLSWPDITAHLAGRPLWAANAHGTVAYDRVDWTVPCALVVGGETEGVSQEALAISRGTVSIPMQGEAESLNAAMAATVLLFEAARQRRQSC